MAKEIRVKVGQGVLEGEVVELVTKDGNYYSFKGIPYAVPPLGKLRFKAPQPPKPWDGVRKATEHGPMCPQVDIFTNQYVPGNEDCLYLNVYSPDLTPKKPHAVMVFVHGGGYKSGSGNVHHYGPDFLVKQGVILVTINYRLDALGFLCLDNEDVPGNAGLKDQVAAFRWVQKNIVNFGGDPNNVTIFGESAGGASIGFHVISPLSKGLFKRGIMMSGSPICDWSLAFEPRRRAFNLGKLLGISTNDPKELLDFLQSVPVEKLVDKKPHVIGSENIIDNLLKMYNFTPVIEKDVGAEHFLTQTPLNCLKGGKVNDVDVMIGYTNQECLVSVPAIEAIIGMYDQYVELFVPRKLLMKITPPKAIQLGDIIKKHFIGDKPVSSETFKEMIQYLNEITMIYDSHTYLQWLPQTGNKRYLYQFSCESERNIYSAAAAKYNMHGAAHLEDLLYILDPKYAHLPIDKEGKSYKMIVQSSKLFSNFAKFGTPTPDQSLGVTWHEYSNSNKHYLDISESLTSGVDLHEDELKFWDELYAKAEN